MNEIDEVTANKPSDEALVAALRENWSQARHLAEQRAWHINLHMIVLAGVFAIAFREPLPLHQVLANYWTLFGFAYIISLYVFFDVAKQNLEINNHMRSIQWISEKLCLNNELSEERKEIIEKAIGKGKLSRADKQDIMYQGYMALPLPIFHKPMRVHELLMYFLMICTAGTFVSGFILGFGLFSFLAYFRLPADLVQLSAYLIGFILGLASVLYCRASVKGVKARKLMDLREPDDIRLRYREEPRFWED